MIVHCLRLPVPSPPTLDLVCGAFSTYLGRDRGTTAKSLLGHYYTGSTVGPYSKNDCASVNFPLPVNTTQFSGGAIVGHSQIKPTELLRLLIF